MILPLPIAAVALAAILFCFGYSAYGVALSGLPLARTSMRLSAAAGLLGWLLLSGFYALGLLGLFSVAPAVVLASSTALLTHGLTRRTGVSVSAASLRDVRTARAWLASLPVGTRLLLLGVAVYFAAQLVRGLIAPPLGYDSLTYHLVKAGRWVQRGAFDFEVAPDAARYYEWMPEGGEVLWAWLMLPVHGDALLALGPVSVMLAILLGAYASARALGIGPIVATEAAISVVVVPAVSRFMGTAYVDNVLLAAVLLGFALLVEARERPRPFVVFAAVAALAGGVSTKLSGAPLLAVCSILLAAAALRAPRRLALAGAAAAAALVVIPHYALTWVGTGNPLYPAGVSLPGLTLPGNEELASLLAGGIVPPSRPHPTLHFLWELASSPLNFAPLLPAYVALAGAGAVVAARRRALWLPLAVLGLIFAITVAGTLSPKLVTIRDGWAWVSGRLVTPAYAVLILLSAFAVPRRLVLVWTLLNAVTLGWAFVPMLGGLSGPDLSAMASWAEVVVPASIGGAVLLYGLRRLGPALDRRLRGVIAVLLGVVLEVVVTGRLGEVRTKHRYPIWDAAARGAAYGPHTLVENALAWPLWAAADDGREHVVAFSAGWQAPGHNWFRYPFMGEYLTNTVTYVPVSATGEVIDTWRGEELSAADPGAWLRRLGERRVDLLALIMPWPLESAFVRDNPGRFDCFLRGIGGYGALCRVSRR